MQDVMEQAQALLVKAEHDIRYSTTAVAQATQKLQRIQQEAAEAAEAVWKRQLAEHEAIRKQEQEAYQAEQVYIVACILQQSLQACSNSASDANSQPDLDLRFRKRVWPGAMRQDTILSRLLFVHAADAMQM